MEGVSKRRAKCVRIVGSCCSPAEVNKTLKSHYTQYKNKRISNKETKLKFKHNSGSTETDQSQASIAYSGQQRMRGLDGIRAQWA